VLSALKSAITVLALVLSEDGDLMWTKDSENGEGVTSLQNEKQKVLFTFCLWLLHDLYHERLEISSK
jgi:hypothetical protein